MLMVLFATSIDSTSRTWTRVRFSIRRSGLTTSVSPIVPEITSASIGWNTV